MRKASTRRSDRRARERSTGRILMMARSIKVTRYVQRALGAHLSPKGGRGKEPQCLFADCRAATECSMLEPRATGDIAGTGVWIRNADVGMMLLEC